MFAIYEGEGAVWNLAGSRICAEQIKKGALSDFSLLIMPGGKDRPYQAALQGEGNRQIRSFVEEGGIYLGICAGAYYGCKEVAFDVGMPMEVHEQRELCFFDGIAIGPAFGKGTFQYDTEQGARFAKIGTERGIFYSYYNGGCYFSGDFQKVRILGRYLELEHQPPAVLECPFGKGKAILTGVHLEIFLAQDPQNPTSEEMEMEMKDRLACIGAIIGQ